MRGRWYVVLSLQIWVQTLSLLFTSFVSWNSESQLLYLLNRDKDGSLHSLSTFVTVRII